MTGRRKLLIWAAVIIVPYAVLFGLAVAIWRALP